MRSNAKLASAEFDFVDIRTPTRGPAAVPTAGTRPHLAFVNDRDPSLRQFLSLVLQGSGLDTVEFVDVYMLRAALVRQMPDIVFLDVGAEIDEAAACLAALGAAGHRGQVQLTLGRGADRVSQIKTISQ
jgi:hypothetical protein